MSAKETWRPAYDAVYAGQGRSRYEVSDLGRVRLIGSHLFRKMRIESSTGRLFIACTKTTEIGLSSVGALVLNTFIGRAPCGYASVHLNGDFSDCRLVNLKWGPRRESVYRKAQP